MPIHYKASNKANPESNVVLLHSSQDPTCKYRIATQHCVGVAVENFKLE